MITFSIIPRSRETEPHGIRLSECEECQKKFEVDCDIPNYEDIRFCNDCYNNMYGEEGEAEECICKEGIHDNNRIDCGCKCHRGDE